MKSKFFPTARELVTFVNTAVPTVTVVSITYDATSAKFVLFYNQA